MTLVDPQETPDWLILMVAILIGSSRPSFVGEMNLRKYLSLLCSVFKVFKVAISLIKIPRPFFKSGRHMVVTKAGLFLDSWPFMGFFSEDVFGVKSDDERGENKN